MCKQYTSYRHSNYNELLSNEPILCKHFRGINRFLNNEQDMTNTYNLKNEQDKTNTYNLKNEQDKTNNRSFEE